MSILDTNNTKLKESPNKPSKKKSSSKKLRPRNLSTICSHVLLEDIQNKTLLDKKDDKIRKTPSKPNIFTLNSTSLEKISSYGTNNKPKPEQNKRKLSVKTDIDVVVASESPNKSKKKAHQNSKSKSKNNIPKKSIKTESDIQIKTFNSDKYIYEDDVIIRKNTPREQSHPPPRTFSQIAKT